MKKAALITHGPLNVIGGVERCHRYLLNFLKKEGFEVDVFEPSMKKMPAWLPGFFFPFRQYFFTGRPASQLQENYDLIITSGYTGGGLRGKKVLNFCFGSVKSLTNCLQSKSVNWKLNLMNRTAIFFDSLSKKGKTCVAISDQVAEELKKDYRTSGTVVTCAIDTNHFSPRPDCAALREKWGIKTSLPVGVYTGRWAWNQKGLDILSEVMRKRNDIHWMIVPDGEIKIEGVRNLSIISGAVYESLPELYSLADFSIQLSRYESFGYSFVESLACGTPVVTTPAGAAEPSYRNTALESLLIPKNFQEPKEMIRQVDARLDLIKDEIFRRKLSILSREIAIRNYSLELWNQKMRDVLKGMEVLR